MNYTCSHLTPEQVEEMRDWLLPIYDASYASCAVNLGLADGEYVLSGAMKGEIHIFVGFEGSDPQFTMAVQFLIYPKQKAAAILGTGGRNMRKFLAVSWRPLLDWMRANGATALYTDATERNAGIYARYGFDKRTVRLGQDL